MPDAPPYADVGDDADATPDRGAAGGMPRWVKISLIVAAVVAVLVVVMLLVGGDHNPGRHV